MEQKRILWIVAVVGIFLLVVIGAALILYAPPNNSDPVMASVQSQRDIWVHPTTERVSNEQKTSGRDEQSKMDTQELAITIPTEIMGDTPVVGTASYPLAPNTLQTHELTVISGNTTVYSADGVTSIDLSAANIAKQPLASTTPAQSEKAVTTVTTRLPSTSSATPKAVSSTTPKVASTPAPKAASTPAAKLVPAKKPATALSVVKAPANQYWVQAASFISKKNAEEARSALSREKIPAEVFTHDDARGITYYRVRVGPYTTKSEAEYWNSLIKLIDQFGTTQSYVTNSTMPYSG